MTSPDSRECRDERFTEQDLRASLGECITDDDVRDDAEWYLIEEALWRRMRHEVLRRLPRGTQWDAAAGLVSGFADAEVLREIVFEDAYRAATDRATYARIAEQAIGRPVAVETGPTDQRGRWIELRGIRIFYPVDPLLDGPVTDSQAAPDRPQPGEPDVIGYTHWAYFPDQARAALASYRLALDFDCLVLVEPSAAPADARTRLLLRASRPVRIATLLDAHAEVETTVINCGGVYDGGESGPIPT